MHNAIWLNCFVRAGPFKAFRIADHRHEPMPGFLGRAAALSFNAVCMENHPTAAVSSAPEPLSQQ